MIELIAVLRIAANISSAAACTEFWMISSVIGSCRRVVTGLSFRRRHAPSSGRIRFVIGSCSRMGDNIADAVARVTTALGVRGHGMSMLITANPGDVVEVWRKPYISSPTATAGRRIRVDPSTRATADGSSRVQRSGWLAAGSPGALDQERQKCYTGWRIRIHADQEPQDQPCNRSPGLCADRAACGTTPGYRCRWQRAISSGKHW